jgi:hypothetical protein
MFFYTALWTVAAFSLSLSYTQLVGLLGWGSTHRKAATYTQNSQISIKASSGIRSHNASTQEGRDDSWLRRCGHNILLKCNCNDKVVFLLNYMSVL